MRSPCFMILFLLTECGSGFTVVGAWAKSQARIDTRQCTRRNSRRQSGFFLVASFQHVQFMTGWKGYLRVGRFPCTPVVSTFPACHQSRLIPWVTGSKETRSLSHGLSHRRSIGRTLHVYLPVLSSISPNCQPAHTEPL